ncbi:MAG: DUF1501 domain-containing protein [Pirellulales bacterium]|nr:DUF1501 domain-containing protein [Pirellulales bacterium]
MTVARSEQARFFQRRTFLRLGGVSALGVGLPWGMPLPSVTAADGGGRAKSVIMLYMIGGPPQHETFDMKPAAGSNIRGEFKPISTAVPGFQVCEYLPLLASAAEKYAVIRSVHHDQTFHAAGVHYNLTGWQHAPRAGQPFLSRRDAPSVGAVLEQLEGRGVGLPRSIQLPVYITQDGPGTEWAGQHAGFLGPAYDPLIMDYKGQQPGTLPGDFVPGEQNGGARLAGRTELLAALDRNRSVNREGEARQQVHFQREALGVLGAAPKWQAFCIDEEPAPTRVRYGDSQFGRSCLVARRLVQAGVRMVTVAWPILPETPHFDTHADNFPTMKKNLPVMDRAVAALLHDLEQQGILDETLVVCTGEFGRTPVINPNGGRDHWGPVYSTLLAGAGVAGGQVYGSSDKQGGQPQDHPIHVSDFVATIYHALGYDRNTRVVDYQGRPHYIVKGQPVLPLFT